MVSGYSAIGQTPVEALKPWLWPVLYDVPVYFLVYAGAKWYCMVTEAGVHERHSVPRSNEWWKKLNRGQQQHVDFQSSTTTTML